MMNRLRTFMIGRRGIDQLGYGLLVLCLILSLLQSITGWLIWMPLAMAGMVWCYVRILSRNLARREQENRVFLQMMAPFARWGRGMMDRIRYRKTHRFFHCPQCRQTLRLPKGKGAISITCPKCSKEFVKKT